MEKINPCLWGNVLKEAFRFTYIFISHDLTVVKDMSGQSLVMNKGHIEELDDANVIYDNKKRIHKKN